MSTNSPKVDRQSEADVALMMRELRRSRRAARRSIVGDERRAAETALSNHVLSVTGLVKRRGGTAALYQHDDGEPDVTSILDALSATGMTIALPILRPGGDAPAGGPVDTPGDLVMSFKTWVPGSALTSGTFDLLEPVDGSVMAAGSLDAIIVPLVVFDATCNRAGRGAGFYDRALGPIRNDPDRPLLIGVAFEAQRAANVPRREHDVPMDLIVTELGIRWNPAP